MLTLRRLIQIELAFDSWISKQKKEEEGDPDEEKMHFEMQMELVEAVDNNKPEHPLLSQFLKESETTMAEMKEWYLRDDEEAELAKRIAGNEILAQREEE